MVSYIFCTNYIYSCELSKLLIKVLHNNICDCIFQHIQCHLVAWRFLYITQKNEIVGIVFWKCYTVLWGGRDRKHALSTYVHQYYSLIPMYHHIWFLSLMHFMAVQLYRYIHMETVKSMLKCEINRRSYNTLSNGILFFLRAPAQLDLGKPFSKVG